MLQQFAHYFGEEMDQKHDENEFQLEIMKVSLFEEHFIFF